MASLLHEKNKFNNKFNNNISSLTLPTCVRINTVSIRFLISLSFYSKTNNLQEK